MILLSSLAAHAAVGNLSAYSATKGAIDTLVTHFAAALGERGIRVNAVAPGVMPTDMSSFAKTQEGRDFILGMQALKRLARPEDIAAAIAFPASDQSQWITGDTLFGRRYVRGHLPVHKMIGSPALGWRLWRRTDDPMLPVVNGGYGMAKLGFIRRVCGKSPRKFRLKLAATGVYWDC